MSQAFARSILMHSAILQIMNNYNANDAFARILGLGEYKSRGHGGKHRPNSKFKKMSGSRSRYDPHQGVQEVARRVRQSNGLPSIPRPLWYGTTVFGDLSFKTRKEAAKFSQKWHNGYTAYLQ